MTLTEYLKDAKLSRAEFADQIGCATETVRRYIAGERYPTPKMMKKIIHHTGGAVQPNDFFMTANA